MNRKQRRQAEKQKNSNTIGTIKPPFVSGKDQVRREIDRQIDTEIDRIRTEAANRSLNLIMGAMILVLTADGNNVKEVEHLIHRIVDKMEGVMGNGITFEELMHTCSQKGFAIGDMDYNKVKKTADEVMTLIEKYEGMKDMSTRTDCYSLFAQGETDCSVVANKVGCSKKSAEGYKTAWNKEQKKLKKVADMTADELAERLFGEDEVQEIAATRETEELKESVKETVNKALIVEDHIAEVGKKVEEKIQEEVKEMKKGLRKVVKVIAIEGEFATYQPVDAGKGWSIEIEGQVFVLSRTQMDTLAEELKQVAEENV